MTSDDLRRWIQDAFRSLPAQSAHAFRSIWDQRLLTVSGVATVCDSVDEQSSALVWSALQQDRRLLVVLPDFAEHRRATLLATGLVYSWLHPKSGRPSAVRRQRVIYFGTHIGIREQLASIRLKSWQMTFSDAFPQYNLGRLGTGVGGDGRGAQPSGESSHTPEVITVYAPADPKLVLDRERPDWVAVDLGDQARVPWLASVLAHTRERQIPVVAWGLNPLSDAVGSFQRGGGLVHIWPLSGGLLSAQNGASCGVAVGTSIQPLVLEGQGVDSISGDLRKAVQELASTRTRENSLARAAVLAHWRFLRSVEALCVPVDFHEAEAQKLYGLRSFRHLQQSCKSFQGHCSVDYQTVARLETAESRTAAAVEMMRQTPPPLWRALTSLIIDEPKGGETRYLSFSSRSRKQLFLLALLAYYNITETDLAEIGTVPVTFAELRSPERLSASDPDSQRSWSRAGAVLLIGVPSPLVTGNLLPCFFHHSVDVLTYAHQESSLARRAVEWASRCNPDPEYLSSSVLALSGVAPLKPMPSPTRRIALRPRAAFDTASGHKAAAKPYDHSLLHGFDAEDELSKLFSDSDGDNDASVIPADPDAMADLSDETEDWRKDAVYLAFEQGWHGVFAPNERLHVIIRSPEGLATEQRYISSLRVHDRVLLIYGERRQSFYDLLISRVHRHPTFALHAALVKRWQEEITHAFYEYRRRMSGSLTSLHRALLEEGSTISYPAVRLWLVGETLCPDDPDDVRRMGTVLHIPFVVSNYRRIHAAAKRLGDCHRALSRRLNSWLRAQAVNSETSSEQDIIDAELGITFDDFKSSLMLLRITDKRTVAEPVFKSRLGRLERN
jgi:hypothetical protein